MPQQASHIKRDPSLWSSLSTSLWHEVSPQYIRTSNRTLHTKCLINPTSVFYQAFCIAPLTQTSALILRQAAGARSPLSLARLVLAASTPTHCQHWKHAPAGARPSSTWSKHQPSNQPTNRPPDQPPIKPTTNQPQPTNDYTCADQPSYNNQPCRQAMALGKTKRATRGSATQRQTRGTFALAMASSRASMRLSWREGGLVCPCSAQ